MSSYDNEVVKKAIEKEVKRNVQRLKLVQRLIEAYFYGDLQLKKALESLEDPKNLKEKFSKMTKRYDKRVLYLAQKIRYPLLEVPQSLISFLYNIRKNLKAKIQSGETALVLANSKVGSKEKEAPFEYVFDNFKLFKGTLDVGTSRVGKSAYFNQKIYSSRPFYYYHSYVKGGGLVRMKDRNDLVGTTLALVFSKNYLTLNSLKGYVLVSNNVLDCPPLGTFKFENPEFLEGSCENYYLLTTKKGKKVHLKLLFKKPKLKQYDKLYVCDVNTEGKRFKDVHVPKKILERLLPPWFTFRSCYP